MQQLNKTPRFTYGNGKVLAYDAETSWVLTGSHYEYDYMLGWLRCSDFVCQYDEFGGANCSIGSTSKECNTAPCEYC
jgi:hypothetical protein